MAENFPVDVVCMKLREGGLISYQEDESLEAGIKPNVKVHRVEGANWFLVVATCLDLIHSNKEGKIITKYTDHFHNNLG